MSELNIRDAIESDLPAIVAIYNAAIPGRMATGDLTEVDVENRLFWFHQHTADRYPVWVAEIDGWVVGWLSFQAFYGRAAYSRTAELSVYIAPDHQRCGVGRQLLGLAIERCSSLGFKNLLAFIFGHNEPSLRLFEQFGFKEWGLFPRVAELDGIERDLIIFGKRVDEDGDRLNVEVKD